MSGSGESDSESDAEYSGIEQPPVLHQLKRILDEYRNDVQIIKELVQNADDAGATELKVLYQGACINQTISKKHKYRKFLKAPALIFHNDAVFSEDDWRGIRAIYSSVKADDPLKIGRFGLGFKSVFHLTDWPCIVSGDRILFIDPHERNPGKVCVIVKLIKLQRWDKLDTNDCLKSLENTFGFTEENLTSGYYDGTMFWFPLRSAASKLSENICDEDQVQKLLKAFIHESKRSLLFLKTICSVKMYVTLPNERCGEAQFDHLERLWLDDICHGKDQEFFSVDVNNEHGDLIQKRKDFIEEVASIGHGKIPEDNMQWTFNVTISTMSYEGGNISKTQTQWLILNHLKGGKLPARTMELLKDDDLCYHHLVGLAAPILKSEDYQHDSGHVFCYQPLPQETKSVTGLPLHVNAFFALSQNRRHVKWPDENEETAIDKATEWNVALVSELLPEAYVRIVCELVALTDQQGNQQNLVKAVYNAIPDLRLVNKRWTGLAETAIENLRSCKFLLTEHRIWISPQDAMFAYKDKITSLDTNVWENVTSLVKLDEQKLVIADNHVVLSLETTSPEYLQYLTPETFSEHLQAYETYKNLSFDVKMDLLRFLTVNGNLQMLLNLTLLPLEDGTYADFTNTQSLEDCIYNEQGDIVHLFSEQKHAFVSTAIDEDIQRLMGQICASDDFQVRVLSAEVVVNFIRVSAINVMDIMDIENVGKWLQGVWTKLILERFSLNLNMFDQLPIFPVNFNEAAINDSTDCIQIACLNDILLVKPDFEKDEEAVCQAFQTMGVTIVTSLPPWLDTADIRKFLHNETLHSLEALMERISEAEIQTVNKKASSDERRSLLDFLSGKIHVSSEKCKAILSSLEIFEARETQHNEVKTFTSISHCKRVVIERTFPVRYPFQVITLLSDADINFAKMLGADVLTDTDLLILALDIIDIYTIEEVDDLMFWILESGHCLEDKLVLDKVREVRFLDNGGGRRCCAYELFDLNDKLLQNVFRNEHVFPCSIRKLSEPQISSLKKIGLKQREDVTPCDIERTIEQVHSIWENDETFDELKVNAVMELATKYSGLFRNDNICDKKWVSPSCMKQYPTSIPLYNRDRKSLCSPATITSSEYINLIGSVAFVQDCESMESLSEIFLWRRKPMIKDVISHLSNVVRNYRSELKSECLQMITQIYVYLATYVTESTGCLVDDIKEMWQQVLSPESRCIWNGDGFSRIDQVYVKHNEDDIDLKPYMHLLPDELHGMEQLFQAIGCICQLGLDQYVSTLKQIKQESEKGIDPCKVPGTLRTVINILNKLKTDFQGDMKVPNTRQDLYFPVESSDTLSLLILKHVDKCTIKTGSNINWLLGDDDNTNEEEDVVYFVHSDVPIATAEALGVRSVKQQMLSDADAFEEWGQEEPLTRRLRVLLKEGYVDGFSMAKELLQNADDAGATKLYLMYDERVNEDARELLLSEELAECQGPALWVFNDAQFSENDFKNITKLNGGTKEDDSTKIGKFGLGFCAVYNLTDVPSFVSGDSFVMFDPHTTFLRKALPGKSPGLRINFGKKKNVKTIGRFRHQFQVFDGIFDCNILNGPDPYFKGTLFRLPLRKRGSEISDTVYTHVEVVNLIHKVVEMAPNMFIFNQNVTEMKIFHLGEKNTKHVTEIYHLQKKCLPRASIGSTILLEASQKKENDELESKPLRRLQDISILAKQCPNIKLGCQDTSVECSWIVAWATGSNERTLSLAVEEKGALPLGSVAIPVKKNEDSSHYLTFENVPEGFYKEGHFFFFLPLPVVQSFLFHINSQFSITSDRRNLRSKTSDEMDSNTGEWNECLMNDVVVNALLHMLENGKQIQTQTPYQLWPLEAKSNLEEKFRDSFYDHITETPAKYWIFARNGMYLTLGKVIFLDPILTKNTEVRGVAFEMLSFLVKENVVVEIPDEILNLLRMSNSKLIDSKTVSRKEFILKYFLPNLSTFGDTDDRLKKRDIMLRYALMFKDKDIENWIRKNPCIPVQPDGDLKLPSDIVDPNVSFAKLFEDTDSQFPLARFSKDFELLERLRDFGMMYKRLSEVLEIDRARSVSKYNDKCSQCSIEQCKRFVSYLSNHRCATLFKNISAIPFLPVKKSPPDWPFAWKAEITKSGREQHCSQHKTKHDEIVLQAPVHLYQSDCQNLVGCVKLILDESLCGNAFSNETLYTDIGVSTKRRVDEFIRLVIDQLKTMSSSYKTSNVSETTSNALTTVSDVYMYLETSCTGKENRSAFLECLKELPSVWVGDTFVVPSIIAEKQHKDCRPHLYRLKDLQIRFYPRLCETIGIRDTFTSGDIVRILQKLYGAKENTPLDDEEFQQYLNLLECLADFLKTSKNSWKDVIDSDVDAIHIPDEKLILRRNTDLCFDDFDEMEKSETMIYVHSKISPHLAKTFDIKRKAIKNFEENSDDIEDFYQEEPLISRLKRLVDEYPCDIGIFKELLQNAEDAGASEIHFIIDTSTHPTDGLLDPSLEPIQGPALCVYNDSPFTQADLDGIQKLGRGSKDKDPSKTGRYGVGFNAVYNITDAPSFLTKGGGITNGETLCLFDPMAKYVPGTTKRKPGKRLKNLKSMRDFHAATLSGYHETRYFKNGQGTMFRFPLRTNEMKSEIKEKGINVAELDHILDNFISELADIMIFLKNVSKICITRFENQNYVEQACVMMLMDKVNSESKKNFNDKWKQFCQNQKSSTEPLFTRKQETVLYETSVETTAATSYGIKKTESTYLVVQCFGFRNAIEDTLRTEIVEGRLQLLPHAGLAYHMANDTTRCKQPTSKVFCFLPLPIESGLPVHIHGYFSLDHESRRNLWYDPKEDACSRSLWNKTVVDQVLCPAYILFLETMRQKLTCAYTDSSHPRETVVRVVDAFHSILPLKKSVKGFYVEYLLNCIYRELVSTRVPFLPVLATDLTQKEGQVNKSLTCCLSWTSRTLNGHHFPAFQSDEAKTTIDFGDTSKNNNILRSIGMRLVCVNQCVRESMTFAGVGIKNISPEHVINFLCSTKEAYVDRCKLEEGQTLQKSVLQTTANTNSLLQYILKDVESFCGKLKQLPVMLTQDCVFRTIGNSVMFVTQYTSFFPSEEHRFIHKYIESTLCKHVPDIKTKSGNKILPFGLDEFVQLAEQCATLPVDRCEYVHFVDASVSKKWLKEFWKFFASHSQENKSLVTDNLTKLGSLSIVPVTDPMDNTLYLCNPKQLHSLLDLDSFTMPLKEVFNDQTLPSLEKEHMGRFRNEHSSAYAILKECIAKSTDPNAIVECLYFHKQRLEVKTTKSNSEIILRFFCDHLPTLKSDLIEKIKDLHLFFSITGNKHKLTGVKSSCVVPITIPHEGILDILQSGEVLLIKEDYTLRNLYKALGISELSWTQVYLKYILPNESKMERPSFYKHIEFIANHVHTKEDLPQYTELLLVLRHIPFIETKADRRSKPSDLFDRSTYVFAQMCKDEELLPKILQDKRQTLSLLKHIGLQCNMTCKLFERFGREIEEMANQELSNGVRRKSRLIVKTLLRMDKKFFEQNSFSTLSQIRFVEPLAVNKDLTKIHEQYKTSGFVTFSGSVVPSKKHICWTSCNILSEAAVPNPRDYKIVCEKLRILTKPNSTELLAHVKSVGKSLRRHLSQNPNFIPIAVIKNVMEDIYGSLKDSLPGSLRELRCVPLILFQTERILLPPRNVVIVCTDGEEVQPHLIKLPQEYLKYQDVFLSLGVYKEISCDAYAAVLVDIKTAVKENTMMPKEKADAEKAMLMLFKILSAKNEEVSLLVETLFLPCDDGTICESPSTVVNNNDTLKERLSDDKSLQFASGFEKGVRRIVTRDKMIACLQFIPCEHRPHLLTEMVEEHVDLTHITHKDRQPALQIEQYIRSQKCIYSILRLAKHSRKEKGMNWTDEVESSITTNLSRVELHHVSGICTYLKIFSLENGRKKDLKLLKSTSAKKSIHIEDNGEKLCVYFQTDDSEWEDTLREQLSMFFNRHLQLHLKDKLLLLNKMLNKGNTEETLSKMLDNEKIDIYQSNIEIGETEYPTPGSFVPKEFHKHLDNDYGVFQTYDFMFIAYLLDDPSEEDDETEDSPEAEHVDRSPTYIYVHILRKKPDTENRPPLMQEYEIDAGEENTRTVPAYMLFKFVRKRTRVFSNDKTVVLYDRASAPHAEPVEEPSKSLKEICDEIRTILIEAWKTDELARKRIVKRLLLKWHPDKNPDKITLSTKVFQYIQQCIKLLEAGKKVPEFKDDGKGNTPSGPSGSGRSSSGWDGWYDRYWKRHRKSYDDDYWTPGSSRGWNSGGWNKGASSRSSQSYQWFSEAKRWQEQARYDLRDAISSLSDGGDHTNNLICYKAFQAAEKSLKGAWYAKDANKVRYIKYSHELASIAAGLCTELHSPVSELIRITGGHRRMRYPDTMCGTIPAHAYTRGNADAVTILAKKVIDIVQRHYIR